MPPMSPRVAFTDLVTMFQSSVARFGARPLFGTRSGAGWSYRTYGEVGELVDQLRAGLCSLGVKKGDRVGVISNNRVEWAVGCYATYGLGATYVPMYEAQHDGDWQFILADCSARVCLVANADTARRVQGIKAAGHLPELQHIITFDGQSDEPGSYAQLLEIGRKQPVASVTPSPSDVAGMIYTSGTTGNPKGVRLTHKNLASNTSGVQQVVPFATDDRSLAFLPWAHVYGGSTELHGIVSIGASMAICGDTTKIVDYLAEVRPTVLFAVPRIWNRIHAGVVKSLAEKHPAIQAIFRNGMSAASKRKAGQSLSLVEKASLPLARRLVFSKIVARFGGRLKYAVSGAAALSREVAEFIDNLGVTVFEGYGLTESSSVASTNTPAARRIGSVGKPLPGVSITLDHTAPGGDAEVGEIIIHGPGVMDGYHNLPDETAKALTADGGLRSGDLGRFDREGFLFIVGRVKELYKLENGKYVAPAPLEEKLTLSPFIAQAMVHGANRPFNVALIVPDLANLRAWAQQHGLESAPDKLLEHAAVHKLIGEELARQSADFKGFEKVQRFFLVGEELSIDNDLLTPTLKVKRRNVLKRYSADIDKLYDKSSAAKNAS